MSNKQLFKDIEEELGKRLNEFFYNDVMKEFRGFIDDFVTEDFYSMYQPIYYQRKFRLSDPQNWHMDGSYKNSYSIYFDKDIKGRWMGSDYYLVQLVEEGNIRRRFGKKIKFIPFPLIDRVRKSFKEDVGFQSLLKRNGLRLE